MVIHAAIRCSFLAAYAGYSRVHTDKHFVEDVVVGAAVDILSSFYFTESYKGVEITPVISNDVYGVYLSIDW